MIKKFQSKHFTLNELTYSATAVSKGIKNEPNEEQIENLQKLAVVLDRIREWRQAPLRLTCAFRNAETNTAVNSKAKDSAHLHGLAADIACPFGEQDAMMLFIKEHCPEITFAQNYIYKKGTKQMRNFIHVNLPRKTDDPSRRLLFTEIEAGKVVEWKGNSRVHL